MADTLVLETNAERCAGSTPVKGTELGGKGYVRSSHFLNWILFRLTMGRGVAEARLSYKQEAQGSIP